MASTLARFQSSGLWKWEHLETLVYATPVDNEEALRRRTVDAYQTIPNYPGIFERL
jgi:hypothetical protein